MPADGAMLNQGRVQSGQLALLISVGRLTLDQLLEHLDLLMELVQVGLHDDDLPVPRRVHTLVLLVDCFAVGTGGLLARALDFGELTPRASVVGPAKHL